MALAGLLYDTERYLVVARLPRFNWETGQPQDPQLILSEADAVDFTAKLDPRLLRAREANIVLVDKAQGIARIDLTRRSWEIWLDRPGLRQRLTEFNQQLLRGAHSRLWGSAGYVLLMFFAPLISYVAAGLIWTVASAKGRRVFWGAPVKQSVKNASLPHWLSPFGRDIVLIAWPIFAAAAICMVMVWALAGGLRVWPEFLTRNSVTEALYRIRHGMFTSASATVIISAVITAVLTAALTFWFAH